MFYQLATKHLLIIMINGLVFSVLLYIALYAHNIISIQVLQLWRENVLWMSSYMYNHNVGKYLCMFTCLLSSWCFKE